MLRGPGLSGSGQARKKQPMSLVLKAEGSAGKEAGSTCGSACALEPGSHNCWGPCTPEPELPHTPLLGPN